MKKLLIPILFSVIMYGCATTVDTTTMSPQEHFDYAMSLYKDKDYLESVSEFQNILLQYPGNQVSDDAQFYLAESYFGRKEYILAAYEYSRLIRDMAASEFLADAQYKLAESYYLLSPNYQLDQKYTKKSIEEFQAFLDFFPSHEKVSAAESKIRELNNKLAEKEMNNARIYEKLEYYDAAIFYYTIVTDTYHDSRYASTAQYKKIQLLKDRKENQKALHEIASFMQKYPDDPHFQEMKDLQEELSKKS